MKKIPLKLRSGNLIIEIVTIVLSVLLALAVNDWRESRKTDSTVRRVLSDLKAEIIDNDKEIRRALDYHKSLVVELRQGGRRQLSIDLKKHPIDLDDIERMKRSLRTRLLAMGIPLPASFDLTKLKDLRYFFEVGGKIATIKIEADSLNIYAEGGIQLRSAGIKNLSWETAQAMQVLIHIDYTIVAMWAEIYKLQAAHDKTVSKILDKLYDGSGSILPPLEDLVYFEQTLLEHYGMLLSMLEAKNGE